MSKIEVNTVAPQCGTTLTLGESGDTVTLGTGASQSGFGRTGTVDWQTGSIKTSTFTATNGEGYFANTSGSAFTMNLPAGSAGAIVSVVDYTNTFQTYALTIAPNGSEKIGGVAAPFTASTEGQSLTFVYVDGTEGWKNTQDSTSNAIGNEFIIATGGTITECGNDRIHTFTGPGTFTVTAAAQCAANNVMSHLVVAGGGGGSTFGGGGAGGFREVKSPVTPYTASPLDGYPSAPNRVTVSAQAYPITVGAGGSGGPGNPGGASNGNPSIFSSIISTAGGGGNQDVPSHVANPGGSGGGGQNPASPGGSGNTPPTSPPQGNNGGVGIGGTGCSAGGGGGGATAVGTNASPGSPGTSGNGGAGATTNITGSPVAYAGGGGGGGDNRSPGVSGGFGGTGGGGNGNSGTSTPGGAAGTTNRGGGGGGAGFGLPLSPNYAVGATGGSGIVVIRYKFQ